MIPFNVSCHTAPTVSALLIMHMSSSPIAYLRIAGETDATKLLMPPLTAFCWKLVLGDCTRISYTRLPATPSVVSNTLSHSFSTVALTSACVDAKGLRDAKDWACICDTTYTRVITWKPRADDAAICTSQPYAMLTVAETAVHAARRWCMPDLYVVVQPPVGLPAAGAEDVNFLLAAKASGHELGEVLLT